MGSLQDLADIHRASPLEHLGKTEYGYTSHKTTQVQGLQDEQHKVTLRDRIPSIDEKTVMVQEDQAREPWSSYNMLYTREVALKLPMKLRNPNTPILGYDAILVQQS